MPQLLLQTLVERKDGSLGASIVDIGGLDSEGGHTGNVDNMSVVALDHGGQELLRQDYGRNDIDGKDGVQISLGHVQERSRVAKACTVDEHGRVAVLVSDVRCGTGDGARLGQVALDEEGIGT